MVSICFSLSSARLLFALIHGSLIKWETLRHTDIDRRIIYYKYLISVPSKPVVVRRSYSKLK